MIPRRSKAASSGRNGADAGAPPRRAESVGAPVLQRSVADLRALAHPLRLRMMELFAEAPRTTKQVATLLGEPPTRLYHHAAALERAGLIVVKETRQRRGAVEKLYAGVGEVVQGTDTAASTRTGRAARRALAVTVLEQATREIRAVPAGAAEAALLARMVMVVPPDAIADVRRRLYGMLEGLRAEYGRAETGDAAPDDAGAGAAVKDENCVRWAVTMAFAPVSLGGDTGSAR